MRPMSQNIVRWNPLHEVDRFFDDDFMGVMHSTLAPAIDVYQDKDNVIVEAQMPGIDPEKVDIDIENDVLTISADVQSNQEVQKENFYRKEIRSGSFARRIILPMSVKADKASADYEKGMLTITLPKIEEVKPKKVAVRVKGK